MRSQMWYKNRQLPEEWVGCEQFRKSITQALIAGVLSVLRVYLAILLLLKAAKSFGGLVKPLAGLVPESLPAENLFRNSRCGS